MAADAAGTWCGQVPKCPPEPSPHRRCGQASGIPDLFQKSFPTQGGSRKLLKIQSYLRGWRFPGEPWEGSLQDQGKAPPVLESPPPRGGTRQGVTALGRL